MRIAPPPETPAVVAETGEEIEKALEELRGRLEEEGRPESADLMERLDTLADEMQRGEVTSLEEALAALDRMETQTAALGRDAEEMGRSTGFEEILKELAEDPFTREMSSALASGERRALRRALERMAGAMTGDQARDLLQGRMLERLASRLMEMSRMLRMAGESELASILKEAAEALRAGDLDRARELLQSPALLEALEAAAGQGGGPQSQMARDLSNLIQHARYMLGMGSLKPLEKPGQCEHGGGGPWPGKGSTNEQAGGYITEDPLMRDRQSNETSGMTGDWEALYDSQVLEAESWEDVQASGKVGPSGEVMSEVGRSLGTRGEATLPLRPLAAPAAGRAEGAADLERVPPGYRDMVRRYFQRFRDSSPTQTEAGEP
jgi:predicted transcriptional regulator